MTRILITRENRAGPIRPLRGKVVVSVKDNMADLVCSCERCDRHDEEAKFIHLRHNCSVKDRV